MKRCLLCGQEQAALLNWRQFFLVQEAEELCGRCLSRFQPIEGERCQKCSRPLESLDAAHVEEGCCCDCLRWEQDPDYRGVLSGNLSLFTYNEAMQAWISRFKYRGDYVLARCFSKEIKRTLQQLEYDVLTVIPLSEERLRERGFNQAKALAEEAGLGVTDILQRMHAEKQAKKSRAERMQRKQVFSLVEKKEWSNQTIVIVDDIYTTGSTVRQAAKLLKGAGAKDIYSFTLSRG